MIDLSPLIRAHQQLLLAMEEQKSESQRTLLRDGLIQRFEFTWELSTRMLRRYLEASSSTPDEVTQLDFENLIRLADEAGLLLSPVAVWKKYREARNLTSHTYNEQVAIDLVSRIPSFEVEVRHMISSLARRIGTNA